MVPKPSTKLLLFGCSIIEIIEGMLRNTLERKQSTTRVGFVKCFYHWRMVSVIHQKLPTFSW
jgi:hypothetical protein